jgi:spermidine synthase
MLLVGLGGGSLVKQYDQDGWKVEAVEIDEKVIDIAQKYFRLKPDDARIYQMDGRQFLSTTKSVYNVVLLDAFGSSAIPFHLVTAEAFGLVASHLAPDGMFAINIESKGWDDPIINMIVATLKVSFTNVVALPMSEPPDRLGNVVLLASNRPLEPEREIERNETLDPDWRYGAGYARVHAWDNRFTPDITGVPPLTDDLNPIDLRAEEINKIARSDLHQYFGTNGRSW